MGVDESLSEGSGDDDVCLEGDGQHYQVGMPGDGKASRKRRNKERKKRRKLEAQTVQRPATQVVPKKKKIAELPPERQNWLRAKWRMQEKAEDAMFLMDLKRKPQIQLPLHAIRYAVTIEETNAVIDDVLQILPSPSSGNFLFLGIDTEGADDTLQIYTQHGDREFAILVQISHVAVDNFLPKNLHSLLTHECVVFCGKIVEREMSQFLKRFHVADEIIARMAFIDPMTLFRFCDVLRRPSLLDAVNFCRHMVYVPDQDRALRHLDRPAEDYGLRFLTEFFLDAILDKRLRNKWPIDWSLQLRHRPNRGKMTDVMKVYSMTDAYVAFLMVQEATKLTGAKPADFVQVARTDIFQQNPNPYRNGLLLGYVNQLHNGYRQRSSSEKDLLRTIESRMVAVDAESKRRDERHRHYVAERDPWRSRNGLPHIHEDDPFDNLVKPPEESSFTTADGDDDTGGSCGEPGSSTSEAVVGVDAAATDSVALEVGGGDRRFFVDEPVGDDDAQLADDGTTDAQPLDDDGADIEIVINADAEEVDDVIIEDGAHYSPSRPTPASPTLSTSHGKRKRPASASVPLVRPPKATKRSGRSFSKGGIDQVKPWSEDVLFLDKAEPDAIVKRLDKIVERSTDQTNLVNHLMFIIIKTKKNVNRARLLVEIFGDNLPLIDREPFLLDVIHSKIFHSSFLHTVNLFGIDSFGGELVIDHLKHDVRRFEFLDRYLACLTIRKAIRAVEFASSLIGQGATAIQQIIQAHPLFPNNYFEEIGDVAKLFSDERIAELARYVCKAKEIPIPELVRHVLAKILCGYLLRQFEWGSLEMADFMSMLIEGLERLEVDADVAIKFFRPTIFEVAEYMARKYGKTVPAKVSTQRFRNPRCTQVEVESLIVAAHRILLVDNISVNKLEVELQSSPCIAIAHHEPPSQFPDAPAMDHFTIRTTNNIFHALVLASPSHATRAVELLRDYTTHGNIYARSPQSFLRVLRERYQWRPDLVDITPIIDQTLKRRRHTMSDITGVLLGAKYCWRARVYSAHVLPSREALHHQDIYVSTIFAFGSGQSRPTIAGRDERIERVEPRRQRSVTYVADVVGEEPSGRERDEGRDYRTDVGRGPTRDERRDRDRDRESGVDRRTPYDR